MTLKIYVKALKKWVDEGIASAEATRSGKDKRREEQQETGREGVPLKITPADGDDFAYIRDYLVVEANKLMEPMLEQEASITLLMILRLFFTLFIFLTIRFPFPVTTCDCT